MMQKKWRKQQQAMKGATTSSKNSRNNKWWKHVTQATTIASGEATSNRSEGTMNVSKQQKQVNSSNKQQK